MALPDANPVPTLRRQRASQTMLHSPFSGSLPQSDGLLSPILPPLCHKPGLESAKATLNLPPLNLEALRSKPFEFGGGDDFSSPIHVPATSSKGGCAPLPSLKTSPLVIKAAAPISSPCDPRSPRGSRPDTPLIRKSIQLGEGVLAAAESASDEPALVHLIPSPPATTKRDKLLRASRPSPKSFQVSERSSICSGSTSVTDVSDVLSMSISPRFIEVDAVPDSAFVSFAEATLLPPLTDRSQLDTGRHMNPYNHAASCLDEVPPETPRGLIGGRLRSFRRISAVPSPIAPLPPLREHLSNSESSTDLAGNRARVTERVFTFAADSDNDLLLLTQRDPLAQ